MKIGIIGCGHMGSAIAKALLAKGAGAVWISDPVKQGCPVKAGHLLFSGTRPAGIKLSKKEQKSPCWTVDNCEAVKKTDIVVIAVKPDIVQSVLAEIQLFLRKNQILISIAAGIPLQKLAKWSGRHKKIVRVMPNLAAQVLESMSVWKASKGLNKKEKQIVARLLNSFGKSLEVKNEDLIDIATAVCGGGPAYTAAFLESMAQAAQSIGFSSQDAKTLALQSALGSIIYIEKTGIDFSALKNAVQTKGGTTEAGFKVLRRKNWQKTLEQALLAGYKKARGMQKSS